MSYYDDQFGRLNANPDEDYPSDFEVMIQLSSEHGKTNFMNITPDQLRKIREVMEGNQ